MKTLLLLGFGRIGREVAKRARAFDLTVLAYDPYVDASVFAASGVTKVDDWRALLPIVDVVSVHVRAGIDVFDAEPPPTSSPLLTCEDVILSPHTASLTGECVRRMSITAAENILAAFDGNLDAALVVIRDVLRRTSCRPL